MSLIIRNAYLPDAKKIAALQVCCWQSAYKEIFPTEKLKSLSLKEKELIWLERLNRPVDNHSRTQLAEFNDEIIGFCSFGIVDDFENNANGTIFAVYFSERFWGKGYAQILMASALQELKALGCKTVSLWVIENNLRARAFYNKLGFKTGAQLKHVKIFDLDINELCLSLSL